MSLPHTMLQLILIAVTTIYSTYVLKRSKKLLRNDLITSNEITAEAIQKITEHDKQWQDRTARKMNEVTKTVATKTHFSKVRAGDTFYEEVINVLPHIGITLDKLKENNKTTIMKKGGVVGDYLDRVKKIAKDPSLNDLTDEDLSEMSEDDILKYFVHADKSTKLHEIEEQIENKRALINSLFRVAAKEISPHYKKLLEKTSTQGNDEIWGDGDDASAQPDTGTGNASANIEDTDTDDDTNDDNNS